MAVKLPTVPPISVDLIEDEATRDAVTKLLKYLQTLQKELELKL